MKKILILSANPINTNRLRLDEEVREIREALKRAQKREAFQLIPIGAVRIDDLRRTLLDNKPQIVHFSGHVTESNDLVLENISGESQVVNPESISKLFELFKEEIECVLLNACYSEIQAEAIHRHINCVIGMVKPIQDRAAINFSKGFYDAIFSGRNYVDAFSFGCNNIDLNNIPESNTPTIKIRSPKQYKRLRRLALAGMIIPILSSTGFYVWQLSTRDTIKPIREITQSPPQPTNPKRINAQADLEQGYKILNSDEQGALDIFKRFQQLDPNEAQKEGLKIAKEVAGIVKYLPKFNSSSSYLSKMRAATVLAPNSDEVWYLLGEIYAQSQQYDDAITALKKAETINHKNADVLLELGQVYNQQQNYSAAVESLQAGLELKPKEANSLFVLGLIFHKQGNLTDAISQYLKASALDPKYLPSSTSALNNIGLINYEQGNVGEAIRQWTAILKTNSFQPPVETQLALGVALYTQGERQQSQKLALEALNRDPRYQNIEFLKQNLWGDRLLADTKKFLQFLKKQ